MAYIVNDNSFWQYNFVYDINEVQKQTDFYNAIMEYPKENMISTMGDRLDNIAYKLYNDENLWIILAIYNSIKDPIFVPDEIYFIPKEDLINMINYYLGS